MREVINYLSTFYFEFHRLDDVNNLLIYGFWIAKKHPV